MLRNAASLKFDAPITDESIGGGAVGRAAEESRRWSDMEKPLQVPLDARVIDRALSELATAARSQIQVIEDPAAETAFALPAIRLETSSPILNQEDAIDDAPVGSPAYWRRQMRLDAEAPTPVAKRSIATWVRKLTRRAEPIGR